MIKLEPFKKILNDCDIGYLENQSHIILKECPNCNGSDKLWVYKGNLLWRCFKCEGLNYNTAKGNFYTLLRDVLGFDKFEIKQILKENEIPSYVPEKLEAAPLQRKELIEDKEIKIDKFDIPSNFFLLDGSETQLRNHMEVYSYLVSRHVTNLETIQKFKLRYNPAVKRLVFPVYNGDKTCVGVQTRDITDRYKQMHLKCQNFECSLFRQFYFFKTKEEISHCPECRSELLESFYPKSSNSRNFPKTEIFFNQQNIDWTQPVAMVEGPFDCTNTPNAIGLLGRTLSYSQLWIILNNLKAPLILFLDGDQAGTESTIDVYHKLSLFVDDIKICLLENGDDPGSHSIEENKVLLSQATHPHTWFINKQIMF
jgi:hypothetical protein